jgi:hypothetical protein
MPFAALLAHPAPSSSHSCNAEWSAQLRRDAGPAWWSMLRSPLGLRGTAHSGGREFWCCAGCPTASQHHGSASAVQAVRRPQLCHRALEQINHPRDKVDSVSGWPLWHLRIIARDCRLENSVSSGAVVAVLAVCSHMAVFAAVLSPCWLAGCIPLCQGLKCYLQLTVTLPGWTPPSGFPLPLSQPFSTQINAATSRLLDRARISEEDKKTHIMPSKGWKGAGDLCIPFNCVCVVGSTVSSAPCRVATS